MPEPLPLPIRVLVKGASTVNWTSPMGGPRSDLIFPRVIQDELHERGMPCDVQTYSVPSEQTRAILATWEQQVLGYSPDVVILVFGHYETIHLLLPRWLERHANSLRARPRTISGMYRRLVLRPLWKLLAQLQAAIDARVEPTVFGWRPRRVAADLTQYIRQVRKVGSPLVYVFELLPPTRGRQSWFPGMARRIEVMNETLSDVVARFDEPDIRYFRVTEVLDTCVDGDLEAATPDGFHYSPLVHRAVGAALAEDVARWAEGQTHLGARRAVLDGHGMSVRSAHVDDAV